LLAAFDLIAIANDNCRFGDAGVMRTAGELLAHGRPWADVVRILARARDLAPKGRHKIVLTPSGEAALQWSEGLTTLEGQVFLPLDDDDHASVDDLFQRAAVAEAVGDAPEAERLYDLCARADRADAIAPYNWGNLRLAAGAPEEAALAYRRALERDPRFVEARYNLAQALEALERMDEAAAELEKALTADPAYADAVFNLAQLRLKAGDLAAAKALFERYLTLDPPREWAATARRAVLYCTAGLLQ
jgi:tetratricopeptide (TPR) repeat protein